MRCIVCQYCTLPYHFQVLDFSWFRLVHFLWCDFQLVYFLSQDFKITFMLLISNKCFMYVIFVQFIFISYAIQHSGQHARFLSKLSWDLIHLRVHGFLQQPARIQVRSILMSTYQLGMLKAAGCSALPYLCMSKSMQPNLHCAHTLLRI